MNGCDSRVKTHDYRVGAHSFLECKILSRHRVDEQRAADIDTISVP